jgi:hypothetical protein
MSDEQTDTREDEDVEAHKFVTEDPAEDDTGKLKTKLKLKTKTRTSDDIGDELGDRAKI